MRFSLQCLFFLFILWFCLSRYNNLSPFTTSIWNARTTGDNTTSTAPCKKKKEENSLLTEWIYFIFPCVCQEKEKDILATGEDFVSHFGVFRDSWLKWSRRNNIYLLDAWSLVLFSSSLTAPCCFFLFFRSLNFPNLEKRLENIFKSGCHVKQSDENNVCTSPGENLCVQIWIIVLYVFSWPRPFGKISFFEGSNQKCEIPADVKQNVK